MNSTMSRNQKWPDILSLIALGIIATFSVARYPYLPQFVDGYYHLSVAQSFLKSGGWNGWAWWELVPIGRPHLYPPGYHFLLALLLKTGVSGLTALKITEAAITPLFFVCLWLIVRRVYNKTTALLSVVSLSSFFLFYASVSGNVPASLAIIIGLLSWYFFVKKQWLLSCFTLAAIFYVHAGICWLFWGGFLLAAILTSERRNCWKVLGFSLLLASSMLYHQFRYLSFVSLPHLTEAHLLQVSIFIVGMGIMGCFWPDRKKFFNYAFLLGMIIVSGIVFFSYPYRLFSAQGMLGLAILASRAWERAVKNKIVLTILLVAGLFFCYPVITVKDKKPALQLCASTYYYFVHGQSNDVIHFQTLLVPQYFSDIITVVKTQSANNDVIAANSPLAEQMLASLANRAHRTAMLTEIGSDRKLVALNDVSIIVLFKTKSYQSQTRNISADFEKIYENDLASVYKNKDVSSPVMTPKAALSLFWVGLIVIGLMMFIFVSLVVQYPREESKSQRRGM